MYKSTVALLAFLTTPVWAQLQLPDSHWSIDSKTGCRIWNDKPNPLESVFWTGECINGTAEGEGVVTWLVSGKPFAVYIGKLKRGKAEGPGTLTYANGTAYIGEFGDGVPNGRGTSTSPDGRKYVGEVRNGKRHGHGTLTLADGSVIHTGLWLADTPIRRQYDASSK